MKSRLFIILGLAACAIAIGAPASYALTPPSVEEWEKIKAEGRYDEVKQMLVDLDRDSRVDPLTEAEILAGIVRDYGLPTSKAHPGDDAGSLRVNLDGNDVIDERDVLPLGFRGEFRDPSMTVPFGTASDGNQPNALVVLLKFPDQEPTDKTSNGTESDVNHNTSWADDHWFDLTTPGDLEATSVGYYYKTASYGKMELDGDVFYNASVCDAEGWITSTYNRADISNTSDVYDAIEDALTQMNPYIDFSAYDANGDGFLDGLVVIYSGSAIWESPFWHFRFTGNAWKMDGITINSGIWSSEEAYIRTWCHEFGHEVGLPDLYDVGGAGDGDDMPGIGYWGLMGSWNASTGKIPPLPCAWSRMHLRFAPASNILTTSSAKTITVNRATAGSYTDTIFKVWRNGTEGKEFFLIEFRDGDHGFDQNLPGGGGILIWHIDENRTSAKNRDNSFDPQRVWLECAGDVGDPMKATNPWYSGFNGDDSVDYFDDTTTPNAKDNAGVITNVKIDPTSGNTGTTMTADVTNEASSGLPTLSWDSPGEGSTVSGDVTMDVTSDADDKVEYYVNGCLKYVESGSPYSGFTWDSVSALDGTATLKAVAYNTTGTDRVRVIERTVTVDNGAQSGKNLLWSENFNSYAGDEDSNLLGLWNLHEDAMGLDIQVISEPAFGGTGKAIAFAQTSFPTPPSDPNDDDTNAGVYQGVDDEWLMTPRLALFGYDNLILKYKVSFRLVGWGEAILVTQISEDDGATWVELEHLTYWNTSDTDYYTGWWGNPGDSHLWASREVSISGYKNKDVYIRFLFIGGGGYNVGMALDSVEITGDAISLSLSSVSPDRAVVGDSITLSGTGFEDSQGSGEVRFYDGSGGYISQASVTSWSNTEIVCDVPSSAKSHATGGIWVYQDFTESNKKPFTVILPAPNLTDLDKI